MIEAISTDGEIIIGQYAGSGVLGASIMKLKNRIGILFESTRENVEKIAKRLKATPIYKEQVQEIIKTTVEPIVEKVTKKPVFSPIGQLEQLELF